MTYPMEMKPSERRGPAAGLSGPAPKNVLIFGPNGSGKGTQGARGGGVVQGRSHMECRVDGWKKVETTNKSIISPLIFNFSQNFQLHSNLNALDESWLRLNQARAPKGQGARGTGVTRIPSIKCQV